MRTIECCPECLSGRVYVRQETKPANRREDTPGEYRCDNCDWVGDELGEKKTENKNTERSSETVRLLQDLDPSEV